MSQGASQFVNWNPVSKIVIDRRTGVIHHDRTNEIRARLGLPIPWTPAIGVIEATQPPIDWKPPASGAVGMVATEDVAPPGDPLPPPPPPPSPGLPPVIITPAHDVPDDPFDPPG